MKLCIVRAQLGIEALEERSVPALLLGNGNDTFTLTRTGTLDVAPPADQVSPRSVHINQQVAQVNLPTGDVIVGHGLKTAEASTSVVTWAPT
jgi:hypothetical protein